MKISIQDVTHLLCIDSVNDCVLPLYHLLISYFQNLWDNVRLISDTFFVLQKSKKIFSKIKVISKLDNKMQMYLRNKNYLKVSTFAI